MPEVKLLPEIPEVFHRLKTYLDDYVYDRTVHAMPPLDYRIYGNEFNINEIILIKIRHRDKEESFYAQADEHGKFEIPIVEYLSYKYPNEILVFRKENDNWVLIKNFVINPYFFLLIVYLISIEFKNVLKELGQNKQDIFIFPMVGDEVETIQKLFKTEQSNYRSTWESLKDKLTLPILSFVLQRGREETVQKSILISEKGTVYRILKWFYDIYKVVNLTDIFLYPYEDHRTFNINTDVIPRYNPSLNKIVFPKNNNIRFLWFILPITADNDKVFDIPSEEGYWYFYVDGEMETDGIHKGTLKIKISKTQPLLKINEVEISFNPDEVLTDDDGSITGIPKQKYVILFQPVITINEKAEVKIGNIEIKTHYFVNRYTLALGVCTVSDIVYIKYYTYLEPKILAVFKIKEQNGQMRIASIHRIWNLPGHIRPEDKNILQEAGIFFRFNPIPLNSIEIIKNFKEVIKETLPVNIGFDAFVSLGDRDQEEINEDSIDWPHQYKGFQCIRSLIQE